MNMTDPSIFLNPVNFHVKEFPGTREYNNQQFETGKNLKNEFEYIAISINNVWSAGNYDWRKGSLSSYETLGYHAATDSLLEGFLASELPIYIHRWIEDKVVTFKLEDGKIEEVEKIPHVF